MEKWSEDKWFWGRLVVRFPELCGSSQRGWFHQQLKNIKVLTVPCCAWMVSLFVLLVFIAEATFGALCYGLGFISSNETIAWAIKRCSEYYLCFESSSLTNLKMNKVPKTIKHKKPSSSPSSLNLSFTNICGLKKLKLNRRKVRK